jgi:hypothetical protein
MVLCAVLVFQQMFALSKSVAGGCVVAEVKARPYVFQLHVFQVSTFLPVSTCINFVATLKGWACVGSTGRVPLPNQHSAAHFAEDLWCGIRERLCLCGNHPWERLPVRAQCWHGRRDQNGFWRCLCSCNIAPEDADNRAAHLLWVGAVHVQIRSQECEVRFCSVLSFFRAVGIRSRMLLARGLLARGCCSLEDVARSRMLLARGCC